MPFSPLFLAVLLLGQTTGKVVSITDGDTLIVRPASGPSVKVRLIHIDAPERGQGFGTRARQALGDLIDGQSGPEVWVVRVEGIPDGTPAELIGKRLAFVVDPFEPPAVVTWAELVEPESD